ncbi:uncharacterized protein FOMMEDRAFT_142497 [Fomitiporia mediterranea MF3/22]|uniref:uncharacterized protein n=1 Tax=Fomitiporia mediterranea (strain MF3/22) TaxID=694068 RepID=UPI0004407FAF|nr:uncharacterized protein FOMMEDRAFT_142497 [Fomitiporia mediterranea MF3/22]EJC99999.1 hypothetical protein FOMMEDRAFT_142497 [Fomitiporia mediterranea MF3/22]
MSAPIENDSLNPNSEPFFNVLFAFLVNVDVPIEFNLEEYVKTPEFDHQCSEKARERAVLSSDESGDSDEDSDDSVCSATTTPYEVPKTEANLYYAGVGPRGRGPKLIYRTSDDKFEEPSGPEAYKRLMRVVAVPDSHEFGQNEMWDTVRDQVVKLLNQRNIRVSSVDFVRFTWLNKKADQEIEEEDDDDDAREEEDVTYDDFPPIQPVEDGERHYTNPTIWIGVLPETLTGAVAHESSKDIRAFLDLLQVQNVDIAYRESVYKTLPSHGPALFRPVEDGGPLKDVIDNVSVPLSLPIAGRKTTMQGTLGPYFCVGNKLYAITVRHNVFLLNGDNESYRYHKSAPKKEVLVMGAPAFTNYLASIQALIGTHIDSVEYLEEKINTLKTRVQDGINVQESQIKLDENEVELAKAHTKIDNLKKFFVDIKKRWSKSKDRVVGFVRWAPPIGAGVAPHRYTRDLCVIELYKEKFKHMIGNVLSLGPELSPSKLKALMYERIDVPSEFKYPDDGLLTLRGMLTADQVNNPNTLNLQGDRIRRVLKRGFTTNTTVGTLTRFMSFVRKYFITGNVESLEVPILSHEHDSGTFSKGGDSGSLIVSAHGEFVALLTGGTNKGMDGSDITFATLFEWIWDLVKEEFPGANLYLDNLQEFLADVA